MRKWGHGSESEKKRNMCSSRYSVALDTLYTLPPPAIAVALHPTLRHHHHHWSPVAASPAAQPLAIPLPTHSIAPHPHHLMLYADADSYVWKMWKKISNPSTRYSIYIFNPNERTTTTSRRRQQQVKSMAAQYTYICRFVLFHPLRVYTSFGFYPEYCVSCWNAVGVSLWYGIWRWCGDRLQLSLRIVVLLLILLCAFSWITWHTTVYVQQTCTFPEEGDTYNRKLR